MGALVKRPNVLVSCRLWALGLLRFVGRQLFWCAVRIEPPTTRAKREARIVTDLVASSRRQALFSTRTDREIANMVLDVWMSLPSLKPASDILSEAIDRLYRANGGPISELEQEQIWSEIEQGLP